MSATTNDSSDIKLLALHRYERQDTATGCAPHPIVGAQAITWETVRGAEPLQFGFRSRPMLARPKFAASRKRRVPNNSVGSEFLERSLGSLAVAGAAILDGMDNPRLEPAGCRGAGAPR